MATRPLTSDRGVPSSVFQTSPGPRIPDPTSNPSDLTTTAIPPIEADTALVLPAAEPTGASVERSPGTMGKLLLPTAPSAGPIHFDGPSALEEQIQLISASNSAEGLQTTVLLHLAIHHAKGVDAADDSTHMDAAARALERLQEKFSESPAAFAAAAEFHAFRAGVTPSPEERQSAWQGALQALGRLQQVAPRTPLADDTLAHLAACAYNQASQS